MKPSPVFLPGVPATYILDRLAKAGGNEVESGKLASPESSAALAVNCFGWFVPRPELLPPFSGLDATFPALLVDVEYQARFPWPGGKHPWLDAVAVTKTHLIGIESKRFEPFRDKKTIALSAAYDRPVWGEAMAQYEELRDQLRSGAIHFEYLDAAQLVKHAFGLVTDARRKGKQPILVYLFAEPSYLNGQPIGDRAIQRHRAEVAEFAKLISGAEVAFLATSYREWISSWVQYDQSVGQHGAALLREFEP
jgi:hypothetical protein